MEITRSFTKTTITVANAETTLAVIDVGLYDILTAQLVVAAHALAGFKVQAKSHVDAPFIDIATVTADFTSVSYPMLLASGDLTVQAVGNGHLSLNFGCYKIIKLTATSSHAAGSTVDLYYGLREI